MRKLFILFWICLVFNSCSKSNEGTSIVPTKYTLTVTASEGGSVSTSGGKFNENTSILITAIPSEGYEFSGWTGTSMTGISITVVATSDQTISANFTRSKYTLTINTVGSGDVEQRVVNSARGKNDYESGSNIRLTAKPQSDYLFYDWQQLQNNIIKNSFENPMDVLMDRSKTVTATFEQKLPLINPDNTDKNNTVGKWKIRKKRPGSQESSSSGRAVDCFINEIILRSDNSFSIITETTTITGQYIIDSETSITLEQRWIAQRGLTNIGKLTEIELSDNYIRFKIELIGICNEELDADRDPTYDEATDPLAPSNTESQTFEIDATARCSIETNLTTNNANQTINFGGSLEDIAIAVIVGSTCTETLIVSSSNLPEGVTVNLDNNEIRVSGTPSSNSIGTFDYSIILNVADPEVILRGTIIIEGETTLSNDAGNSTSITSTETTARNCILEFDNIISDSVLTENESISLVISFQTMFSNCLAEGIDIDNSISINVTGLPDGLGYSFTNNAVHNLGIDGAPASSSVGTHNVVVTASYESQTISQNFTITVRSSSSTNSGTSTSTTSTSTTDTSTSNNPSNSITS